MMASETRPIIFSEKPYAAVVFEDHFLGKKICASCFKFPPRPLRCSKCRMVAYCGQECQKADWESGQHRRECPVFALFPASQLEGLRDDSIIRLVARVLARKDKDGGVTDGSEVVTGGQNMKLRKLSDLSPNVEHISESLFNRCCMGFHDYYGRRSSFFAQFDREALRQVLGFIRTNTMGITDYNIVEGMIRLGTGLYLQSSQFKHSCAPDLFRFFDDAIIRLGSLKPVDLSQTDLASLTIAYGLSATTLTPDRRKELQKFYDFKCECSVCQNEKLDQVQECSVEAKCPECKEGLVVTMEGKPEFECVQCGKKAPGKDKDAKIARVLILKLRQSEADGGDQVNPELARQAAQRLDSVRNIRLFRMRKATFLPNLVAFMLNMKRAAIFNAENSRLYKESCETASQLAATYRYYGMDGSDFPLLCADIARAHTEAGEKAEAKRWWEEARDLWANVLCTPGHHCVKEIQDIIDRL